MNGATSQNSSIPPWLRDESLEDGKPVGGNMQGANGYSAVPGGSAQQPPNPSLIQRARTIHWGLKIGTMLLCVLMSATAVIGLGEFDMNPYVIHIILVDHIIVFCEFRKY